jgi:cytoskeleton protein RodZ
VNEEMFPDQNDPLIGPGKLLQVAREEKKLRPEDVAYEIRLTPSQVLALEEDDYSSMPEETYVRGYLRNYARLVGVPENDILLHFARLTRTSEKSTQPIKISSGNNIKKTGNGIRWLSLGAIIAVILLSALWVLVPHDNFTLTDDTTDAPVTEEKVVKAEEVPVGASTLNLDRQPKPSAEEEKSTESTILSTPVLEPIAVDAASTTATQDEKQEVSVTAEEVAGSESDTSVAQQTDDIERTTSSDSSQAATSDAVLQINYSKDSWTDIRDANGKKLLYRTVKKGEQITLSGDLPMSLFFGFAQGVTVTFNGKEVDVPTYTRGVFARFTVGEPVSQ